MRTVASRRLSVVGYTLLILLLVALPCAAQLVPVTAANILDRGAPLSAGTYCATPQGAAGRGFHVGSTGNASGSPVCRDVVSGAIATTLGGIAAGPLQLADTSLTAPLNVCYSITIRDANGAYVLGGPLGGYTCVQPAANNSWCSAGVCNWDLYLPTIPNLALSAPLIWGQIGGRLQNQADLWAALGAAGIVGIHGTITPGDCTSWFNTTMIQDSGPCPSITPSDATPNMDSGSGSAGASAPYARGDHTHPVDTSRQAALGFTPENAANKSTDGTMAGNSDTNYPSQKATKTYADTKQTALGFTPENVANKSTDGTFAANSDTNYPSQKATKTYADTKAADSAVVHNTGTENIGGAKTFTTSATGPIFDKGGAVYNVNAYTGFDNTGAADSTAAFNTLLGVACPTAGPSSTIFFPAGTYLFNSAEITLPQGSCVIKGAGATANSLKGALPNSGTILNFSYNATDAKLVGLYLGSVTFEDLTIVDTGSDCAAFYLGINTTTHFNRVAFSGTATGVLACNDIIFGGTTNTIGNAVADGFQGYGTTITNSFFDKFRHIWLRSFANGIVISGNAFSTTGGSNVTTAITAATNAAAAVLTAVGSGFNSLSAGTTFPINISGGTGNWTAINGQFTATALTVDTFSIPVNSTTFGALAGSPVYASGSIILIDGVGAGMYAQGNVIRDNIFEMTHYPYGVRVIFGNNNTISGNGFYDGLATYTIADVRFEATTAGHNSVTDGWSTSLAPLCLDIAGTSNCTSPSQPQSYWRNPFTFTGTLAVTGAATLGSTLGVTGTVTGPQFKATNGQYYFVDSTSTHPTIGTNGVNLAVDLGDGTAYTGIVAGTLVLPITENFQGTGAPGALKGVTLTAGTPTSGGSCTAGAHSWKVTFVNAFGESLPYTASAAQTCGANATVPLSVIPLGPAGTTGRNIYATKTGNAGSYYLVATSPVIGNNTATTYSFTIADGSFTATVAPSVDTSMGADIRVGNVTKEILGGTKNLTSGAATTILSIPLATLQTTGGRVSYTISASDGTNQCALTGTVNFAGENSAGVFVVAPTTGAGANEATACTAASTLTDSWALTAANPALLQVTPITSMTATSFTIIYNIQHQGNTQPTKF